MNARRTSAFAVWVAGLNLLVISQLAHQVPDDEPPTKQFLEQLYPDW